MAYSTNRPIISFIVPIYNVEQYLAQCLDSILAQSVTKEIIIVNDGSTDQSFNIALNYAQKYAEIKLIYYHQNQGQSYARNRALDMAQGEYIYCVDSDDYLSMHSLQEIIEFAQQQGNIDLIRVRSKTLVQDGDKQYQGEVTPYIPDYQTNLIYQLSGEACFNLLAHNWIPGICWTLIKRELLQRHQLRFLEHTKAEDQLFYIQLLTCQADIQVMEFPQYIYNYRRRANSTVTTPSPQYIIDHFTIVQHIQHWQDSHHFSEQVKENLQRLRVNLWHSAYELYLKLPAEQQVTLHSYFK